MTEEQNSAERSEELGPVHSGAGVLSEHAQTCAATVAELVEQYQQLKRILDTVEQAAQEAGRQGRARELADLARTAVALQAAAARCMAGVLSLETEGRLAVAAATHGGLRVPLIDAG